MAGLKWNTGKLYYSTVELGYQQGLDPFPPRCLSLTSLFPTSFSLSYLVGGLTLSLTNICIIFLCMPKNDSLSFHKNCALKKFEMIRCVYYQFV